MENSARSRQVRDFFILFEAIRKFTNFVIVYKKPLILFALLLILGGRASAQYDLDHFYNYGRQSLIDGKYALAIAVAKRARQIIGGDEPLVSDSEGKKPLSIAVEELYEGKIRILGDDE